MNTNSGYEREHGDWKSKIGKGNVKVIVEPQHL